MSYFVAQQVFKYALKNRFSSPFDDICSVMEMYAEKTIDHLNDAQALEYLLDANARKKHLIDDR